ncbi:MAG TPA: hypothetical protein VKV29_01585 [Chthonomonas sp.]|uniref:hypothetical protein n=1 Tax=Chthonomonas sp. TaxID=2282153 RepID=UPI002B4B241D|nr:hypothetical protein [Chthonomonas sp.]HLH78954.1 hypothetical protein [Chthonomonas sp.]
MGVFTGRIVPFPCVRLIEGIITGYGILRNHTPINLLLIPSGRTIVKRYTMRVKTLRAYITIRVSVCQVQWVLASVE